MGSQDVEGGEHGLHGGNDGAGAVPGSGINSNNSSSSSTSDTKTFLRVCNVIVPKLSPQKCSEDGSTGAATSSFAFTGTGDCAAALLLAWHDILGDNQVSEGSDDTVTGCPCLFFSVDEYSLLYMQL